MSERVEQIISGVVAAAALVIAVSFAHREFYGRFTRTPPVRELNSQFAPRFIATWKDLIANGRTLHGAPTAITIVEIADFECRFCKQFNVTLNMVTAHYGATVSRVFIDLPLPTHRFAWPAARAAECAAKQGRFAQMHDILFDKQDSIGLKPWVSYARDVGIRDTASFGRCVMNTAKIRSIDNAANIARALGVRMAPTVIVGGWMFPRPPTEAVLRATIDAIRSGKQPVFDRIQGN